MKRGQVNSVSKKMSLKFCPHCGASVGATVLFTALSQAPSHWIFTQGRGWGKTEYRQDRGKREGRARERKKGGREGRGGKKDRGRKEERTDGGQEDGRVDREWRREGGMKEVWWGRTAIMFQSDGQVNCGSRRLRDKQKSVQMVSGRMRTRPQVPCLPSRCAPSPAPSSFITARIL